MFLIALLCLCVRVAFGVQASERVLSAYSSRSSKNSRGLLVLLLEGPTARSVERELSNVKVLLPSALTFLFRVALCVVVYHCFDVLLALRQKECASFEVHSQ